MMRVPRAVAVLAAALCLAAPARAADEGSAPARRGMPRIASERPVAGPAGEEGEKVLTLTLEEAIGLALRNNLVLRGDLIARAAQKFDLYVAESKFSPEVAIDAEVLRNQRRPHQDEAGKAYRTSAGWIPNITTLTPIGTNLSVRWTDIHTRSQSWPKSDGMEKTYGSTPTFVVSQPLLRGFGIDVNMASVTIARLSERINVLGLRGRVSALVTSVIGVFRQVLQLQQQVEIARLAVERSRVLLDINRSLIQAGRMAPLDIVQAEAALAQREYDLSLTEGALRRAELSLLSYLNLPDKPRLRVAESLDVRSIAVPFPAALETALNMRPDYLSARLAIESGQQHLLLARDGARWKLNLESTLTTGLDNQGGYASAASNSLGMDHSDWTVALRLSIPLTDRPQQQAIIHADTALRQNRLTAEAMRDGIDIDVRTVLRDLQARWRQVELSRQTLALAERQVQVEREKLNTGRSTSFQVNQYEADLVTAQTAELGSRIAYLNTIAQLDQVLGTTLETWEIELTDEDAFLRPAP